MMSKTTNSVIAIEGMVLLLLFYSTPTEAVAVAAPVDTLLRGAPPHPLTSVDYGVNQQQPLVMNMSSSKEITLRLTFNKDLIPAGGADAITLNFKAKTLSPQFNILSLDTTSTRISIPRRQLESSKFVHEIKLRIHAHYIGHAAVQPTSVEFAGLSSKAASVWPLPNDAHRLEVTIVQHEGVWGIIFLVCVSILMLISYINLGAQLDEENMRQLIKQPKTLILGFLIGVFVMPAISWFIGEWFLQKQPLFRIGSFIFACGPAASASTLWTVMLNSDKELSVGLQVVSTVGAVFTMPFLLYLMDKSLSLNHEISHTIKVPYARLMQTLFALLVALIIGWRLVGKNERAQKVSRQIFRPLVFSVLIFIIVFSSILYWHIYQMFDWNITLASFLITMLTYAISGMLGHCINCDLDRAVAIAIGSAYKNSGIAFAVLLIAFDAPDTYIAYVPCLTQIVITSITLYLTYLCVSLFNCLRRHGQPDAIQAQDAESGIEGKGRRWLRRSSSSKEQANQQKQLGPAHDEAGDAEPGDTDEFIAMNVTDIDPSSLPTAGDENHHQDEPDQQQVSVKTVVGGQDDEPRGTRV